MKGKKAKAPVQLPNLVLRIKRALKPKNETLRGVPGPRGERELATFYHVKADHTAVEVNPIEFGARLGCIRPWEEVTQS